MLSTITWKEFAELVTTALIIYYLFIAFRYYREDIKWILTGKFGKQDKIDQPEAGNNLDAVEELQAVVNDLKYAVLDKAGTSISKEELLDRIKFRLNKYSGLQKLAFRVALNNYLMLHAKEICAITFNEEELNQAWDSMIQ